MKVLNVSFNVNNSDIEDRPYNFTASVKADTVSGHVSVESGMGTNAESLERVVTFDSSDDNTSLSFFVPMEQQPALLTAVNAFISSAKALAIDTISPSTPEAE